MDKQHSREEVKNVLIIILGLTVPLNINLLIFNVCAR